MFIALLLDVIQVATECRLRELAQPSLGDAAVSVTVQDEMDFAHQWRWQHQVEIDWAL
jgi:hypothetical protein